MKQQNRDNRVDKSTPPHFLCVFPSYALFCLPDYLLQIYRIRLRVSQPDTYVFFHILHNGCEILFCQQLQKSIQKKAALLTSRKRLIFLLTASLATTNIDTYCGSVTIYFPAPRALWKATRSYLAQTGESPDPLMSALLGLLKGACRKIQSFSLKINSYCLFPCLYSAVPHPPDYRRHTLQHSLALPGWHLCRFDQHAQTTIKVTHESG